MPIYNQTNTTVANISVNRAGIECEKEVLAYLSKEKQNEFVVIMAKAQKEATSQSKVFWQDSAIPSLYSQINSAAGYAANATEVVVDDASVFAPNDVISFIRTGESARVTEVDTATNTLTISRKYGSVAAAAIEDNDYVMRIVNASAEGGNTPIVRNSQPTEFSNVCTITKTPWSVTGTVDAMGIEAGGKERARLRMDKTLEHAMSMEQAAIFGELKVDTANKISMCSGLIEQIGTGNVYTVANGTFTQYDLDAYCEQLWSAPGSSDKYLVASTNVIKLINGFAAGRLEVSSGDDTYGVKLRYYQSAFGRLVLVPSRIFKYAPHKYMGIGLDMKNIKYRPLRETRLMEDIGAGTTDAIIDQLLTEWTIEARLKDTHCVLKNAQN